MLLHRLQQSNHHMVFLPSVWLFDRGIMHGHHPYKCYYHKVPSLLNIVVVRAWLKLQKAVCRLVLLMIVADKSSPSNTSFITTAVKGHEVRFIHQNQKFRFPASWTVAAVNLMDYHLQYLPRPAQNHLLSILKCLSKSQLQSHRPIFLSLGPTARPDSSCHQRT